MKNIRSVLALFLVTLLTSSVALSAPKTEWKTLQSKVFGTGGGETSVLGAGDINGIISTLSDTVSRSTYTHNGTIDLSTSDKDKWYPVAFQGQTRNKIRIFRNHIHEDRKDSSFEQGWMGQLDFTGEFDGDGWGGTDADWKYEYKESTNPHQANHYGPSRRPYFVSHVAQNHRGVQVIFYLRGGFTYQFQANSDLIADQVGQNFVAPIPHNSGEYGKVLELTCYIKTGYETAPSCAGTPNDYEDHTGKHGANSAKIRVVTPDAQAWHGDMGIGTSNPDAKLHVAGDLKVSGGAFFQKKLVASLAPEGVQLDGSSQWYVINNSSGEPFSMTVSGRYMSKRMIVQVDDFGAYASHNADVRILQRFDYPHCGTKMRWKRITRIPQGDETENYRVGKGIAFTVYAIPGCPVGDNKVYSINIFSHASGMTVRPISVLGTENVHYTTLNIQPVIDIADGKVGINRGDPSHTLDIGGSVRAETNVLHSSDISKKQNIREISDALNIVSQLRGVYFDWKEEILSSAQDGRKSIGFIAQEVEKILPELVHGEDGDKSVAYANITAVLVEAVKEQQLQIKKQQSQAKKQQAQIKELIKETQKLRKEIQKLKN